MTLSFIIFHNVQIYLKVDAFELIVVEIIML